MIEDRVGPQARLRFIDACFGNQHRYTNDAVGDARPSEVSAIFADLAEEADVFTPEFTKDMFLEHINDYLRSAWAEHKIALNYGVYGVPKHVIDGVVLDDTESSWGAEEFKARIALMQ